MKNLPPRERIVITGVGLAAPNAASLPEFRAKLLAGVSEIRMTELRYMSPAPAGPQPVCSLAPPAASSWPVSGGAGASCPGAPVPGGAVMAPRAYPPPPGSRE